VIPCRAEYVAVARLAILGVANRLSYSYDEVEDVRLAVGEACTHAVERARSTGDGVVRDPKIYIESQIGPGGLDIEVRDNIPSNGATPPTEVEDDLGFDKRDLGALLLEILVDRFSVRATQEGTTVRLVKHAPNSQTAIGPA